MRFIIIDDGVREEDEDLVRGEEISEAKYDEFINLSCDISRNIMDSGEFEKDVEVFRKYLLDLPLREKRTFYRYHKLLIEEFVRNVAGLTADYVAIHCDTKDLFNDKEEKVSPKKTVKKPNLKKKTLTKEKD